MGKSIELKNDLDIRIVTVSNYVSQWEDHRGEIKMITNKGVITGKIPKEMSYQVIKVRFDVSNPNIIGILVRAGKEFRIYRYKIDENNNSLNYEKTVFEQVASTGDESSKLIYEHLYKENGYSSLWRDTIESRRSIHFNFVDFYLDGEEVKPFYGVNTYAHEYLNSIVCYYYESGESSCSDGGAYFDDHGFYENSTEVFFGSNKIASAINICSGGGLQDNGSYRACTNENNIFTQVTPLAIFNRNDYAYSKIQKDNNFYYTNQLSSITTSLPLDLSKYIINSFDLPTDLANGKVSLNSHLLKGDSYSFNLMQKWTGISFSSSLGVLDCGGMLVTDRQLDGGYVTRKDFGFSVLKSCDDFKEINAPSFSWNVGEVSDFYVK